MKFTEIEIIEWLKKTIAAEIQVGIDQVSATAPFAGMGLDSVQMVTLATDLENWLGIETDPTLFYEFGNIAELTRWITEQNVGSQSN